MTISSLIVAQALALILSVQGSGVPESVRIEAYETAAQMLILAESPKALELASSVAQDEGDAVIEPLPRIEAPTSSKAILKPSTGYFRVPLNQP